MSHELVAAELAGLPVNALATDDVFGSIAKGAGFLPRIMLMQATSDQVKEEKAKQGTFYLVHSKDHLDDLTKECPVFVIAWRPKAMDMSKADSIVTIYDHKHPEFAKICERSELPNSNCMFGPEFLVWVPTVKAFATFYMSSKTSRRQAPQMKALMHKAALLKSEYIKTKKYSWFGPQVTMYTGHFELPTVEKIKGEAERFANPPQMTSEAAPEGAGRDR